VLRYTRLFTDEQSKARFDDVEVPLQPADPPPDAPACPIRFPPPPCSSDGLPPAVAIPRNRSHAAS